MQQNHTQPHVDVVFHINDVLDGARGGPVFSTVISTNNGGFEQRNATYSRPLGRWDLGNRSYNNNHKDYIYSFFRQRRGRYQSFLWRDLADYQATATPAAVDDFGFTTQGLVEITANGVGRLIKQYADGAYIADRIIYCPHTIGNLPAGWSVASNGVVTAPGALLGDAPTAVDFTFYTPVRFDIDALSLSLLNVSGNPALQDERFAAVWQLDSCPLQEVRL